MENDYYIKCWKHYFDFKGRARRSELFIFIAINRTIHTLGYRISEVEGLNEYLSMAILGFVTLFTLCSFIPEIAVASRRLHDIGQSGWWLSIPVVLLLASYAFHILCETEVINIIFYLLFALSLVCFLVLFLKDSKPGENKWGLNPKEENNLSQNTN